MKYQTSPIGDVPFYKIGTFGGVADAFISNELFNTYKNKYPYPQKGQVLLSAAGTIGKSVIFDGKDSYFQDSNIVWIDTKGHNVNNNFLHYCFKYVVDWEQYKTDGSVISRLYNDDLRNIAIPFPPIDMQNEISSNVEALESKITSLENNLKALESIKADILKKYLAV